MEKTEHVHQQPLAKAVVATAIVRAQTVSNRTQLSIPK